MTTQIHDHENQRIRLLVWAPFFWPDIGGIEIITARLVSALRERGYGITVITSHGRKDLPDAAEFHGVSVFRFPFMDALLNRNVPLILRIQREVARIVADFRPDVHHLNFGGPVPITFFYLRTAGSAPVPALLSLHSSVAGLDAGEGTILGQVFHKTDWVTACSAAMLEDVRGLDPTIGSRSSVVHYGLDPPEIEPQPLGFGEPLVMCLGRAVEEKGFDLAITAFASLRARYPKARLALVGDGPHLPALRQQATDMGLDGCMDFRGEVSPDKVAAQINTACMVVVPSRWREAFGLVALEAAQMGRPVVAARVGGLPEVVLDGQTGLVVHKDDPRALFDAMAHLMDHPEQARAMGQAARTRALEGFGSARYVDAYDVLFRRLHSIYRGSATEDSEEGNR